jgi:hypothetical protein
MLEHGRGIIGCFKASLLRLGDAKECHAPGFSHKVGFRMVDSSGTRRVRGRFFENSRFNGADGEQEAARSQ